MTEPSPDADRLRSATHPRTAFRWVGVIIPILILLISGAVAAAWLPEVPDPSAVHWSGSEPDGFAPPWVNLVPIGVGIALVALFAALSLVLPKLSNPAPGPAAIAHTPADPAVVARFLAATNLFLAVLLGSTVVMVVGAQRGLSDAADAADIGPTLAIATGVAVVIAIIGWFAQPKAAKRG